MGRSRGEALRRWLMGVGAGWAGRAAQPMGARGAGRAGGEPMGRPAGALPGRSRGAGGGRLRRRPELGSSQSASAFRRPVSVQVSRAEFRGLRGAGRGPGLLLRRRGASRAGEGATPHLHPLRAGTAASPRARCRAVAGRGRQRRVRRVCGAEGCARTPRGRCCALQAGWPRLVNDLLGSGSGAGREQAGKWGSLRALWEGPLVPSLGGHWPLLPHPQECAASVWGCAPDAEGQQSRASSGVRGRPEEEKLAKLCVGARRDLTPWPLPSLQYRHALRTGGHGAKGVGGRHPARGLWGFRADHLSRSGHCTSPSHR